MTQGSLAHGSAAHASQMGHKATLGPLLCWAVVFADIGSSIYYVPGILHESVGGLAGFFVLLTMVVFVLLSLKYADVSARFPEGGGVVSVAAQGINSWAGALGGMFILVSYFLTAAISCLSAFQYLAVFIPGLLPYLLWATIGVIFLLGVLNWIGISESAKVSMIAALLAFGSNIAVLITVFLNFSPAEMVLLFQSAFTAAPLSPTALLVGFASAFLAFSGLESISQLSPVMKEPRKKVIGVAMLLVVLTIFMTSPLLTTLSTLLLPEAAEDPVLSTQLISLLGGRWGGEILQIEVAISATMILIFAGNTAIIGAYHVFMALSKMHFLPTFILRRNRFRNTPHYSIALATGIPILVLILVNGEILLLGDMYAFGLLGAFSLTCVGLDIIRYRERRSPRSPRKDQAHSADKEQHKVEGRKQRTWLSALWYNLDFWLGILTTVLVLVAWTVGLFAKPLGTAFGGTFALLGLSLAAFNYARRGLPPVIPVPLEKHIRGSVVAVLSGQGEHNERVIESALQEAQNRQIVFLYLGQPGASRTRAPRAFEIVDPYQDDTAAKEAFGKAEQQARKRGVSRRFVYRLDRPGLITDIWRYIQPRDLLLPAEQVEQIQDINPDRVRYAITPQGRVAHLVKNWAGR